MRMWALVGRQCLMPFMGACGRSFAGLVGARGRLWVEVLRAVSTSVHVGACVRSAYVRMFRCCSDQYKSKSRRHVLETR